MTTRPLSHLELMTVATKDEQYYQEWLGDQLQELAQKWLGMRTWIRYQNTVTVLSRFGYFASTTLSNLTTLGEDFCQAQPANNRNHLRSLLMVLLNNQLRAPKEVPKFYLSLLKDVHLITFFLFGDFYELAKRVTNFTYSTHDPNQRQNEPLLFIYRSLGCLSALKLLASSANVDTCEPPVEEPAEPSLNLSPERICHLCSSTWQEPTSTLCGHIFCWNCIHKWIKDRGQCPICRTPSKASRLVHLINFT